MSRHDLANLKNLGPASARMLERSGIKSQAQLEKLGAVKAFQQVKKYAANTSLNLLWALEGALRDEHWLLVRKERGDELKAAVGGNDARLD